MDIFRVGETGDFRGIHPFEVKSVEIPVADLELEPLFVGVRDDFFLDNLPEQGAAILQGRQGDLFRPEDRESVGHDDIEEEQGQEEDQGKGQARGPDKGFSLPPESFGHNILSKLIGLCHVSVIGSSADKPTKITKKDQVIRLKSIFRGFRGDLFF